MHNTYDTSLQKHPQIILDYNKTKSAVKTMDKMVRTYTVKGMARMLSKATQLQYQLTEILKHVG